VVFIQYPLADLVDFGDRAHIGGWGKITSNITSVHSNSIPELPGLNVSSHTDTPGKINYLPADCLSTHKKLQYALMITLISNGIWISQI